MRNRFSILVKYENCAMALVLQHAMAFAMAPWHLCYNNAMAFAMAPWHLCYKSAMAFTMAFAMAPWHHGTCVTTMPWQMPWRHGIDVGKRL